MKLASLSARATVRIGSSFAQSNARAYGPKFRMFLSFCCFASIAVSQMSTQVILSFLEFVVHNNTSQTSVLNYLSAIKAKFLSFGINLSCF